MKNAVLIKDVQDMAYYIMHNTATFGCTMMQNLLFNITKITTSFFLSIILWYLISNVINVFCCLFLI